jgi:N-methylhydantoinase A
MISGPALVEEYASTTVLHPGDVLTVDAFGNLVIDVRRA